MYIITKLFLFVQGNYLFLLFICCSPVRCRHILRHFARPLRPVSRRHTTATPRKVSVLLVNVIPSDNVTSVYFVSLIILWPVWIVDTDARGLTLMAAAYC